MLNKRRNAYMVTLIELRLSAISKAGTSSFASTALLRNKLPLRTSSVDLHTNPRLPKYIMVNYLHLGIKVPRYRTSTCTEAPRCCSNSHMRGCGKHNRNFWQCLDSPRQEEVWEFHLYSELRELSNWLEPFDLAHMQSGRFPQKCPRWSYCCRRRRNF